METTEDKKYVCTLDEASLKYAKKELNEDPKDRLGAVQTLRKWIMEQPHLTIPTDTNFLLMFLRSRYFSQLETRQLLESYFKIRTKFPQWYHDIDTRDPEMLALVDTGICVLLPGRDKEGRLVSLFRQGAVSVETLSKFSKGAFLRYLAVLSDINFFNETTQVNGLVSIADMTDMNMKHHTFVSLEDKKNFFGPMVGNTPQRIKAIHIYNMGTFGEFVMGVLKLIMSEKMQKRLVLHSSLESMYKQVPMEMLPDEYLPDDYKGPSAGPIKGLIESLKKHITSDEVHDRVKYLSSPKFQYDKSKRPDDIPQESFRKLNVD